MSNNKTIDRMAAQFTSMEELQAYCDAQYKTIVSLNKKITEYERELESLRSEVASLRSQNSTLTAQQSVVERRDGNSKFDYSDEETTCLIQLAMIRNNAMQRELSNEETKRFETFAKVLHMIRGIEQKKEDKLEEISSEELLKLIDTTMKEPQ
jgi:cell division septum initiation protein DivIVA